MRTQKIELQKQFRWWSSCFWLHVHLPILFFCHFFCLLPPFRLLQFCLEKTFCWPPCHPSVYGPAFMLLCHLHYSLWLLKQQHLQWKWLWSKHCVGCRSGESSGNLLNVAIESNKENSNVSFEEMKEVAKKKNISKKSCSKFYHNKLYSGFTKRTTFLLQRIISKS